MMTVAVVVMCACACVCVCVCVCVSSSAYGDTHRHVNKTSDTHVVSDQRYNKRESTDTYMKYVANVMK